MGQKTRKHAAAHHACMMVLRTRLIRVDVRSGGVPVIAMSWNVWDGQAAPGLTELTGETPHNSQAGCPFLGSKACLCALDHERAARSPVLPT